MPVVPLRPSTFFISLLMSHLLFLRLLIDTDGQILLELLLALLGFESVLLSPIFQVAIELCQALLAVRAVIEVRVVPDSVSQTNVL